MILKTCLNTGILALNVQTILQPMPVLLGCAPARNKMFNALLNVIKFKIFTRKCNCTIFHNCLKKKEKEIEK